MPDVSVAYCPDCYEAVRGCGAAVVVTDWKVFRELDLLRVREAMRTPALVDGRTLYNPAKMVSAGFHYHSIGRPGARQRGCPPSERSSVPIRGAGSLNSAQQPPTPIPAAHIRGD